MNFSEHIAKVETREDFVVFVHRLLKDLQERPDQWENANLLDYLEALAAWVQNMMDVYYHNQGEPVPKHLTWRNLADILLAARIYE